MFICTKSLKYEKYFFHRIEEYVFYLLGLIKFLLDALYLFSVKQADNPIHKITHLKQLMANHNENYTEENVKRNEMHKKYFFLT